MRETAYIKLPGTEGIVDISHLHIDMFHELKQVFLLSRYLFAI